VKTIGLGEDHTTRHGNPGVEDVSGRVSRCLRSHITWTAAALASPRATGHSGLIPPGLLAFMQVGSGYLVWAYSEHPCTQMNLSPTP